MAEKTYAFEIGALVRTRGGVEGKIAERTKPAVPEGWDEAHVASLKDTSFAGTLPQYRVRHADDQGRDTDSWFEEDMLAAA